MIVLFSIIVVDLIAFGIVMPILPFYAERYGAGGAWLGLILTSFAFFQFMFAPLWGKCSDRYGRKPVLILTLLGSAFSLFCLSIANSLYWILSARCLAGAFAGNIGVASAMITDKTREADRVKGMGLIGAAFGIGFLLGPAIAAWLADFGHAAPIFIASLLAAINALSAVFRLKEVVRPAAPRAVGARHASPVVAVWRNPALLRVCQLNFLLIFALTQLETTFAFYMLDTFGWGARQVAYIFAMMALILAAVQGGLIRVLGHIGDRRLWATGVILLAFGLGAVPVRDSIKMILCVLAIACAGRGLAQPSLMSLASKISHVAARGRTLGVFQSASSLARIFGPVTAGIIYDIHHAAPFYLSAAVLFFAFLLNLPNPDTFIIENTET